MQVLDHASPGAVPWACNFAKTGELNWPMRSCPESRPLLVVCTSDILSLPSRCVTGRLYTAAPSRVQHQSKLKERLIDARRARTYRLCFSSTGVQNSSVQRKVHACVGLREVSEDAPVQVLWHPQLPGPVQQECKDLVSGAAPPGSITVL